MQDRLQKIISRAGVASRRAGEDIILAGRVRVNGKVVTELGAKADLGRDLIEVDGKRIVPEAPRYLVLHKPRGVVATLSDPEGRPTVATLLDGAGTRLYPVGRLDFATSGVLLVTNDGDFANALLHPRGGVPKTYVLKVRGVMTEDELERWATGVVLDDGKTLPALVHFLRHEEGKTWFTITIREGRNQQIRRMGEATGFPVMRLARTHFAGITSEGLRPGKWRALTHDELLSLREQFGVPKRVRGVQTGASADAVAERPRRVSRTKTESRPARPSGPAPRGGSARADQQAGKRTGSDRRGGRPRAADEAPPRAARSRKEAGPTHSRGQDGGHPHIRGQDGGHPHTPARGPNPRRR